MHILNVQSLVCQKASQSVSHSSLFFSSFLIPFSASGVFYRYNHTPMKKQAREGESHKGSLRGLYLYQHLGLYIFSFIQYLMNIKYVPSPTLCIADNEDRTAPPTNLTV